MLESDFLEAARAERKRLYEQLKTNAIFKRWRAIGQTIALYDDAVLPDAETDLQTALASDAATPRQTSASPAAEPTAEETAEPEPARARPKADQPVRLNWGGITATPRTRGRKAPNGISKAALIEQTVEKILTEAGKRLSTNLLHEALTKRNVIVAGKTPIAFLSAMLSRSERFDNLRPFGWGLVKWAGSSPESSTSIGHPNVVAFGSSEGKPAKPAKPAGDAKGTKPAAEVKPAKPAAAEPAPEPPTPAAEPESIHSDGLPPAEMAERFKAWAANR